MLTCKQVSNALAQQDYATLSRLKRFGLKLHVALCVVCGRYNRQVMIMQDAARAFRRREENTQPTSRAGELSEQDKIAMKQALRKAKT